MELGRELRRLPALLHDRQLSTVLTDRELNRATLARQHLLERVERPAPELVRELVGLQAQVPSNPYVGLWSRLVGFRPEELERLLLEREAVRTVVMRATIHLVTADDALVLRPLVQPVLDAELRRHRDFAPLLEGVELAPVLAAGRELLATPSTGPELRAALGARFPQHDAAALAYACRCLLPLVQVPPRGLWRASAQPTLVTAQAWLGRELDGGPSLDAVVLRYLAAFGPASVADGATWSRLTGLRRVFERLRPQLATFRDERGRELFDLPDAPRPPADTPAPVRFLPEYDNVLLSHADRGRFSARRRVSSPGGLGWGAVLADGVAAGVWRREGEVVVVRHAPLPRRGLASILAEARRLARFLEAGDVRPTLVDLDG